MKRVIIFGGSNSKDSINKKFALLASSKLTGIDKVVLDLNDFSLPLYGIDKELEDGFPENAMKFNEQLLVTDGIILSLAEHNGSYSTVFKNLFDWLSRIDKNVWKNKPMLLLSATPGGRGGASVMNTAKTTFPHLGGNIVANFSLPFFSKHFSEDGILDEELDKQFLMEIEQFQLALSK